MNSLFPGVLRTDALNSCDDEAFGDLVECTQTCDHNDFCNKYLSGLTDCWQVNYNCTYKEFVFQNGSNG